MVLKACLVLVAQRGAIDATCSHIPHHLDHQQLSMLFTDLSLIYVKLLLLDDSMVAQILSIVAVLLFFILIIILIKVSISPRHLDHLLFLVAVTLGFLLFLLNTFCLGLRLLRGNSGRCYIRFCNLLLGSSCRLKG